MATPTTTLTAEELRSRADRLPRERLAHLPTPLEELPRLGESLGGPRIFIKRDDCTGLMFGGNKARHNEFILGAARSRGADLIVWGAGVQSNNCRTTVAACAKLGIECHLTLSRHNSPDGVQGNLLLDYIGGATVEFTDLPLSDELWSLIGRKADEFRARGRRPFAINDAVVRPSGAVSYVVGLAELLDQTAAAAIAPAAIYACSCGITGAGLVLGKKLLGAAPRIELVMPLVWEGDNHALVADIGNRATRLLGFEPCLSRDDVTMTPDYIGAGYGIPTAAGMEATRLLARLEGILLDPVYTAKAMAALLADIRSGTLTRGQSVIFLHTGGTPAVFAYQREFAAEFAPGAA